MTLSHRKLRQYKLPDLSYAKRAQQTKKRMLCLVTLDGSPAWLAVHRVCKGNQPTNTILAERIIPELEHSVQPTLTHDSSTTTLIRRYRRLRKELS